MTHVSKQPKTEQIQGLLEDVVSRSEMINMVVSNPGMVLVWAWLLSTFVRPSGRRLGKCLRQQRSSLTLLATGTDLA
jgi:hypothetical protein